MERTRLTRRATLSGRVAIGVVGLLAVLAGLAACGANDSKDAAIPEPGRVTERDQASGGDTQANPTGLTPSNAAGGQPTGIAQPLGLDATSRQLIVDATVAVQVADVAEAVALVVDVAAQHGGQVYDSQIDLGDPLNARGVLVLRLPPEQLDDAIAKLAGLGTVLSRSQSTDDVTDVVVDLEARILTARSSVESVRALMDKTTDLDQLVFLENELTNRQTVLEQLLGQQRTIAEQVALATLTVQLSAAPTVTAPVATDHRTGVGEAFATGWHGFVTVLVGIAIAIGYAAPFLGAALVLGGAALVIRRGRRVLRPTRSRSVAPLLPPAPAGDQRTTEPDSADAARSR